MEDNRYDRGKNYSWDMQEKFEISGAELSLLLHATREVLVTPEARRVLLADRANQVLEGIMEKGIQQGLIVEQGEVQE